MRNLDIMKKMIKLIPLVLGGLIFLSSVVQSQSPEELPLWSEGIQDNPVTYTREKLRNEKPNAASPSQKNRVFSQVSIPTYKLYRPEAGNVNGLAVVICPG